MKKILVITISIIMMFSSLLIVGCNKTCEEHVFGEWTVIKATNSCLVEGTRKHTCIVCGEVEQENFYGEHNKYSVWIVESGSHHKVCRTCNERFSEGTHFYSEGECICGKEEVITTFWDVPDFIVEVEEGRDATVLLLTDTQIIDSEQQRRPDRLWPSEIPWYAPEQMDLLCFSYIEAAVNAANPDLIILCGDNIYGEFDDAGTSWEALIDTMDSFEIPWAQVYGNHDNESAKGAKWQNAQLEKSEYCLFKKGDTDGNGNYTIAIKQGEEITRMFYLMDSNWCRVADNPAYNEVLHDTHGFTQNQVKWMYDRMEALETQYGKAVKSSLCFHIPTSEYTRAAAQYSPNRTDFDLGKMTTPVYIAGDFGHRIDSGVGMEEYDVPSAYNKSFLQILKKFSVDTTFAGHNHRNNTSIMYEGIRWTYVLKTGRYDGHQLGELGGTKFSFNSSTYAMNHVYCG